DRAPRSRPVDRGRRGASSVERACVPCRRRRAVHSHRGQERACARGRDQRHAPVPAPRRGAPSQQDRPARDHLGSGAMATVLTSRDGAVLTITLNRPDAYNAFTRELHSEFHRALSDEASDPAIRAVVVTGAGKAFCAGQDIREFRELPGPIGTALEQTYHPNVRALRALPKPVIAAVNGAAAGAGLSLAAACDVRVASDAAVFVPGFIGIGLVPDAGGTWFLHRLLGYARALEWMSSNRRLSAAEALQWGLVSEVIPAAD